MTDLHLRIAQIEELTKGFLKAYRQLQEEHQTLHQKVRGMETELYQKNSELARLERELQAARVAQSIGHSGDEAHVAKAKISSLVREIDRCIALLNE